MPSKSRIPLTAVQHGSSMPVTANERKCSSDAGGSVALRQAALDTVVNKRRFELRANVLTLLACTGVIMYWRGVWSLWCASPRRSTCADMLQEPCMEHAGCQTNSSKIRAVHFGAAPRGLVQPALRNVRCPMCTAFSAGPAQKIKEPCERHC